MSPTLDPNREHWNSRPGTVDNSARKARHARSSPPNASTTFGRIMAVMTARAATELALALDRRDPRPLPVQVAHGVREQITQGKLKPGDALPSTRTLAARLSVSRGTVVVAYDQLLGEGFLQATQGKPTTVHPALDRIHPAGADHSPATAHTSAPRASKPTTGTALPPAHELPNVRGATHQPPHGVADLRPGQPDSRGLAGTAWRSAWRHAAAQPADTSPQPLGLTGLREAVADHLRLMRALAVAPSSLVITAGAREGLTLLLAAVARRNNRHQLRVGLESPGHPGLRQVPPAHGHTVVPCTVDHDGLRVDLLPTGRDAPDVLVVTPSHQYPLGGSLTLDRRLALLEWAQRWDVLIVEDDFDSELRYVGAPLPTLSDLDTTRDRTLETRLGGAGGQVALLGTFSTLLTPALATGYIALPHSLIEPVTSLRTTLGVPNAAVTQYAVAHLLDSGYIRRHTQRMRSTYRRRRAAVQETFRDARHARLTPMHGGVDAVITTELDEDTVVRRCWEAGLLVGRQSGYWAWGTNSPVVGSGQGIVVGFAQADEGALRGLLPRLVTACGG